MHKSCKECAPVCTKVTSYTDLTRAYLLSKRLETWWRKKENTHRLPRPSLCVKGCKGVTMAVSKRENIVLEQQFLVESQLWGFIFLYFYLIFNILFLYLCKLRLWNGVSGGLQNRLVIKTPEGKNPYILGGIPYVWNNGKQRWKGLWQVTSFTSSPLGRLTSR